MLRTLIEIRGIRVIRVIRGKFPRELRTLQLRPQSKKSVLANLRLIAGVIGVPKARQMRGADPMKAVQRWVFFLLISVLATTNAVLAADHPIRGDVLRMHEVRGVGRAMFRTAGDPAIDPAAAPDPRRVGATLEILGGGAGFGASGVITLAPQYWKGLGTPPGSAGYDYADPGALVGVKHVRLSSGRTGGTLAIAAGGPHWRFALAEPQQTVSVRLTLGAETYCSLFDRRDLAHRRVGLLVGNNAAAPSSCDPPVCGNGFIEPGEECDSPLLGAPGCCLPGCVLDSDAFCRPSFAQPYQADKANVTTTFDERIHQVVRRARPGAGLATGVRPLPRLRRSTGSQVAQAGQHVRPGGGPAFQSSGPDSRLPRRCAALQSAHRRR